MSEARPLRAAVLLSGTGRTLENLVRRRDEGRLSIEFLSVVSSKKNVRGLEVARNAGIPDYVVPRKSFTDVADFSREVMRLVDSDRPDVIIMAGFLSLFHIPDSYLGRVVNIHPSLLPLFGGAGYFGHHVHEAVIAAGVRVSGCTVHFVDNVFDHGPVILQRTCPVLPDDDADRLAARVFREECEAMPEALEWIRTGDVAVRAGKTAYSARLIESLRAATGPLS